MNEVQLGGGRDSQQVESEQHLASVLDGVKVQFG